MIVLLSQTKLPDSSNPLSDILGAVQWRLIVELPEAKTTNFYKFWQFSPDEARIAIDVNQASILVNQQQGKE